LVIIFPFYSDFQKNEIPPPHFVPASWNTPSPRLRRASYAFAKASACELRLRQGFGVRATPSLKLPAFASSLRRTSRRASYAFAKAFRFRKDASADKPVGWTVIITTNAGKDN